LYSYWLLTQLHTHGVIQFNSYNVEILVENQGARYVDHYVDR